MRKTTEKKVPFFERNYCIFLHVLGYAYSGRRRGLMVSALVPGASGPGSALAGDIMLCSWSRHLTLTVSLSTQVYKWVPVNCWGKPNKLRENDLRWTSILSRWSINTPSRFMLQKPGISSGSYGPLGSKGFISGYAYTFS